MQQQQQEEKEAEENHLPLDLWREIFWYFTPKNLADLALVSRQWNDIIAHHPLWKNLLSIRSSKFLDINFSPNNSTNLHSSYYYDKYNNTYDNIVPTNTTLDRQSKSGRRQYCIANYELSIWKQQNKIDTIEHKNVKKGMYLCLRERPCRVVELRRSKTGT